MIDDVDFALRHLHFYEEYVPQRQQNANAIIANNNVSNSSNNQMVQQVNLAMLPLRQQNSNYNQMVQQVNQVMHQIQNQNLSAQQMYYAINQREIDQAIGKNQQQSSSPKFNLCYNTEMFINLSESDLETYRCPIGYGIVRNPIIDEHGHMFCHGCIHKWFITKKSCPLTNLTISANNFQKFPLLFQSKLDSMLVRCEETAQGCTWTGPLKAYERHLSECGQTLISCEKTKCENKHPRNQTAAHKKVCQFEVVKCQHCHFKTGERSRIQKHEKNCSYQQVLCDHCNLSFQKIWIVGHYKAAIKAQASQIAAQETKIKNIQNLQSSNIFTNSNTNESHNPCNQQLQDHSQTTNKCDQQHQQQNQCEINDQISLSVFELGQQIWLPNKSIIKQVVGGNIFEKKRMNDLM